MIYDPDAGLSQAHQEIGRLAQENDRLRARLAEVEALCNAVEEFGTTLVSVAEVRAIVSGEGDRPAVAEQMLADVKREHAAAWAAANRPDLGPVECKHSPEWHAGLAWCNNCQPRCAANGCTNRATSTRNSAVPGWPDELACGQHGEEGDRLADDEWELFVLAFDVGFEFMRDLADPEPRWADREEALAWLRDEIQNRRGEGDRPAPGRCGAECSPVHVCDDPRPAPGRCGLSHPHSAATGCRGDAR